jgi:hypothetical protein
LQYPLSLPILFIGFSTYSSNRHTHLDNLIDLVQDLNHLKIRRTLLNTFFNTRRQLLKSFGALAAVSVLNPISILGATDDKVRFAVIGDWGTGDLAQYNIGKEMLRSHQSKALDLVISAGDNIYPNGSSKHFVSKFERPFAGLLQERVPFYTALGNHDVHDGREDQLHYPLFNMNGRNYYKITKGNGLIDFFMIDSTDFDQAQLGWLDGELRKSNARWKIVVSHYPLYSSGKKHGSDRSLRKKLEPQLKQFKVDAVIAGHDHIYERTIPQFGVQHFVTGAGGEVREDGTDLKSSFRAFSYDEDCHYMLVEANHREFSFQAITEQGICVDMGKITK